MDPSDDSQGESRQCSDGGADVGFETWRDEWPDGQEWRIHYDLSDGTSYTATTTLSWIAYRAEQDDDAEVTPL